MFFLLIFFIYINTKLVTKIYNINMQDKLMNLLEKQKTVQK